MESDGEYSLLILLVFFPLATFTLPELSLTILILIVLIVSSGLISGSEVAYFSLTRSKILELEKENRNSSARMLELLNNPRRLLGTILITNNFINISIVVLSDLLLQQLIDQNRLLRWCEQISTQMPEWLYLPAENLIGIINFLLAVVLASFILLVFGEVLPKIYARKNSLKLARFMSYPLQIFMRLSWPFSGLLIRFSSHFEKRLEGKAIFQNMELKSDIDKAIEITASDTNEARDEVDLLKRVLKFSEVPVKQIMKSRVDVVAIDKETSFDSVLDIIKSSGYSRIPVYTEDFDHLKGVLYAKDLIPYIKGRVIDDWTQLIKTGVFYVPDTKMIDDLLREFQSKRTHMAIVVDEYGGNSGIVTLEDVMEEVIGEIKDEFDDEFEQDYHKIDDSNYLFEGKTLINDVCKIMGIDESIFQEVRGDSDSVAGLILEILGYLPRRNQKISVANITFTVVAVSHRRIEQVKVTKNVKSRELQKIRT